MISSFSIPTISPTQSPQIPSSESGGIRLPNAPLHDIASLSGTPASPRKAATAPYFNANGRPISPAGNLGGADYFSPRRSSLPVEALHNGSPMVNGALGLPEVTGWQSVPMSDLDQKQARSRSSSRKPVAA